MDSRKVDLLNIGLILVSLVAAFWMPFALFLFSYAVLGPLHYMTEINWLDERQYFSKSKLTPWLLGGFALLICLGSFFAEGARNASLSGFYEFINDSMAKGFFVFLSTWVMHLVFLSFVVAVAMTAFKDWRFRVLVVVFGLVFTYLFRTNTSYVIIVGSMLPTIIHVCLFTGLFMLYGAMKSSSRAGYSAVLVFVLAYFVIAFWPIDALQHYLPKIDPLTDRFLQSGFHTVIYQLGQVTGIISKGSNFVINSELGVRLAMFLSFAYTYHYLNWFSKTSIIQWHKVPKRKLIWAIVIWIASMALYYYDYKIGLMALLFLSFLHVLFEFPLNYISITGIISGIAERIGLKQGANASIK